MVYQVAQAVNIPILGMGGIINGEDAIEFMLAGANAISTEDVMINDSKYTIEKINNVIVRVNGIYYYNIILLNNWMRGEHTEATLDKYFD